MTKAIEESLKVAENLDWEFNILNDNTYDFKKGDLGFGVAADNITDFIANLFQSYLDFDVSKVTYQIVNVNGRGENGETLEEVHAKVRSFKDEMRKLHHMCEFNFVHGWNPAIVKLLVEIENLGWTVEKEDSRIYRLAKRSPIGQDFSISITANNEEEFLRELFDRYSSFDESEEAYFWLDESGHGKNGAPYHMRDVLDDMVDCKEMIGDLYNQLIYYLEGEVLL